MLVWKAWKLGNLEVGRLGGLEAGKTGGLEARRPGGLQQGTYGFILGAYRKRFGNPGGLETRETREVWSLGGLETGKTGSLEARRPGGGATGDL